MSQDPLQDPSQGPTQDPSMDHFQRLHQKESQSRVTEHKEFHEVPGQEHCIEPCQFLCSELPWELKAEIFKASVISSSPLRVIASTTPLGFRICHRGDVDSAVLRTRRDFSDVCTQALMSSNTWSFRHEGDNHGSDVLDAFTNHYGQDKTRLIKRITFGARGCLLFHQYISRNHECFMGLREITFDVSWAYEEDSQFVPAWTYWYDRKFRSLKAEVIKQCDFFCCLPHLESITFVRIPPGLDKNEEIFQIQAQKSTKDSSARSAKDIIDNLGFIRSPTSIEGPLGLFAPPFPEPYELLQGLGLV